MNLLRKLRRRLHPYKTIQDDYLTRMRGSVAGEGMLHEGNIYCFDYVFRHLPTAGAVLEIGSFGGMSTNVISWLLRKHGVRRPFFTCDPWVYGGYYDQIKGDDAQYMAHFEGSASITRSEYTGFIRDSFIRSTRLFSREALPHTLQLTSDDFFRAWRAGEVSEDVFGNQAPLGGPLSFVYVDGDHTYEAARRDAENALDLLVPGGFLLLDDSADFWNFGSVRLARELRRLKGLELVMKNPNYLFRKMA